MKATGIFFMLLILCPFSGDAQDTEIIRKGLLRAQLTISPAVSMNKNPSYFFLHGNMEAYVSSRLSFIGEGYYSLGSMSPAENAFAYHHSLFFGASRHLTLINMDAYFGLQPGLSISKLNPNAGQISPVEVNPLISPVIGFHFFINRFMHIFSQTRYVFGQQTFGPTKILAEVRMSAGLGFNLNAIK